MAPQFASQKKASALYRPGPEASKASNKTDLAVFGGCGRLHIALTIFLGEALNASGSVDKLLLASIERMAIRADFA